jgi:hypothetical protein
MDQRYMPILPAVLAIEPYGTAIFAQSDSKSCVATRQGRKITITTESQGDAAEIGAAQLTGAVARCARADRTPARRHSRVALERP